MKKPYFAVDPHNPTFTFIGYYTSDGNADVTTGYRYAYVVSVDKLYAAIENAKEALNNIPSPT